AGQDRTPGRPNSALRAARRLGPRARKGSRGAGRPVASPGEGRAVKALNFYPTVYQAHLLASQKRCTIRLGDKRDKYREGDIVWVTYGSRFAPRQKLFAAVIDRVTVKRLEELTEEELRAEDP